MEYCGKQLPASAWDTCFLENIILTRLRCSFRSRYKTVEGRDKPYPIHTLIWLILIVTKEVHHFKKWTPGGTDMRQLLSSHSSYDQAYPAVTINDLFPGVTVTINSPKFSHPHICNIRPCRCSFSNPKNQSVPWLSPSSIWTTNEVPCWHNPRKAVLTVFRARHFDWS